MRTAKLQSAEAAHVLARTPHRRQRRAITDADAPCKKRAQRSPSGDYPGATRRRLPPLTGAIGATSRTRATRMRRAAAVRRDALVRSTETAPMRCSTQYAVASAGASRPSHNDFGPAGQIDAVVAPLDALGAARRDHSASRAAPPNAAAATSAAHDPVPDEGVGPTPRSQIRMRTRSGASTCANSTLVPCGKQRVIARAPRPAGRNALASGSGPSSDALRVAEVHDDECSDSPAGGQRSLRGSSVGMSHGRAERSARAVSARPADARQRLRRRPPSECVTLAASRSSSRSKQRRQAADAVAGDFGPAAVGVEQLHRRRRRPSRVVEDQAVGADAGVAIAHLAGERVERGAVGDSPART